MKTPRKWIIIVALLCAALTSYYYGISQGIFLFMALGVMFELLFWFGIFSKKPKIDDISR